MLIHILPGIWYHFLSFDLGYFYNQKKSFSSMHTYNLTEALYDPSPCWTQYSYLSALAVAQASFLQPFKLQTFYILATKTSYQNYLLYTLRR